MGTMYVENNGNLAANGDLPSYNNYVTPEYRGPSLYPDLKYTPECGVITRDIHKYTIKLLDQAAEVAQSARKPIKSSSNSYSTTPSRGRSGGNINIDMSSRTYSAFSTTNNTTINNGGSGRRGEKDNTATLIIAFIGGAIAILGGAYLMGKFTAKNETLDKEIRKFAKLENKWDCHRQAYAYNPEYEKRVNKIIELTRGIMQRNQSDLFASIYKVALPIIVSGGLLVTGAVFSSIPLISIGALGLVGVGGYAVYKAVKNANSDADKIAADKIFKNIDKLRTTELYDQTGDFFNVRMKFGTLG